MPPGSEAQRPEPLPAFSTVSGAGGRRWWLTLFDRQVTQAGEETKLRRAHSIGKAHAGAEVEVEAGGMHPATTDMTFERRIDRSPVAR